MPLPKITVVIVTYNGEKWIDECIRSIIKNRYDRGEIVVVDNASQDSTHSIIRDSFKEVVVLRQSRNLGYGRGANIGIQYAISKKTDYILLLNQDIKLDMNAMGNMVAVCEQNREIGIASPLQMNYDGSRIDPHFKRLYSFNSDIKETNEIACKDSFEVETVIGASMFFRASVLDKIGYFDPIFFLYHEEGDLCRRARYHGFKIHIIPKAIVYHKHMQLSPQEMTYKAKFCSTYGYYIYTLKNPFQPFRQNFYLMLIQMKEWICRDRVFSKIAERFVINGAAAFMVMLLLPRIIKNRASDINMKYRIRIDKL